MLQVLQITSYGEDIADTKSPFEMTDDYGTGTVSSGNISSYKVL